jgi:Cdc6-like AAA superfamily ATPase
MIALNFSERKGEAMPVDFNLIKATSTDPSLFINREEDVETLKRLLRRALKDTETDDARGILVKGDSGVGKSILSRKVVSELALEFTPKLMVWSVDGGRLSGSRGLLNRLTDVAHEEIQKLGHQELAKLSAVVAQAADYGKVTSGDVSSISKELSAMGKIAGGILGMFTGESSFGWKRTTTKGGTETFEILITEDYLAKLISRLLEAVKHFGFQVLIFLDNLDRIGRMDSQEDANTIAELVKQLLELPDCVLVINLRSQFTHHTTDRRELTHRVIKGLKPEALKEILQQRLKAAALTAEEQKQLSQLPFQEVADKFSRLTDNPLAFLRWLDFWLVQTNNRLDNLGRDFRDFIEQNFTGVDLKWLKKAVEELQTAKDSGLSDAPLTTLQKAQLLKLERAGTVVPDSLLLDPTERRYRLIHDLDFLFDSEFAKALN